MTKRLKRLRAAVKSLGRLKGDHSGHLAGDRFGGSNKLDNIVAQLGRLNQGEYKIAENRWTRALKQGRDVTVDMDVAYEADSLRPSAFNVTYTIDGKIYRQSFKNS